MVFIATFNNISVKSYRFVLLVGETGVPEENHRPVASNFSGDRHWLRKFSLWNLFVSINRHLQQFVSYISWLSSILGEESLYSYIELPIKTLALDSCMETLTPEVGIKVQIHVSHVDLWSDIYDINKEWLLFNANSAIVKLYHGEI